MSNIVESVILADEIMHDFDQRGFAADFVYYEVLERAEEFFIDQKNKEEFVDYLSFTMGFDGEKHFDEVFEKAKETYKEIKSMLDGTFDPDESKS